MVHAMFLDLPTFLIIQCSILYNFQTLPKMALGCSKQSTLQLTSRYWPVYLQPPIPTSSLSNTAHHVECVWQCYVQLWFSTIIRHWQATIG